MTPHKPITLIPNPPVKNYTLMEYKQNKINDRTRRQLFKKNKYSLLLNAPIKPKNTKILMDLKSIQRQIIF